MRVIPASGVFLVPNRSTPPKRVTTETAAGTERTKRNAEFISRIIIRMGVDNPPLKGPLNSRKFATCAEALLHVCRWYLKISCVIKIFEAELGNK
jgi:hypothetical protein